LRYNILTDGHYAALNFDLHQGLEKWTMRHGKAEHWQAVYRCKKPSEVSWFAPHLNISIELLKRAGSTPATRLIDIGAGASTLIDDLPDLGLREEWVINGHGSQQYVAWTE